MQTVPLFKAFLNLGGVHRWTLLNISSMSTSIATGERYECNQAQLDLIRQTLTFPVAKNVVAKNRLVKAPMIEMLASFDLTNFEKSGLPTEELINLNRKFAAGGCAINVTGGIIVTHNDIEGVGNVIISKEFDSTERRDLFRRLAATTADGSLIIGQILHPGKRTICVSRDHLRFDINTATADQLDDLVESHVYAAEYLWKSGFHGVELNVSLDFALGQMVTASLNERTDEYGGSLGNRTKIIIKIIENIRNRIKDDENFVIGMKLSSPNYEPHFDENEFAEYCKRLDEAKLDYVLLAGGHYQHLEKYGSNMAESTKKRETFFVRFGELTRKCLEKARIIICGGFVTAEQVYEVLNRGAADAVAMGRALTAEPDLLRRILDGEVLSARKSLISHLDYRTTKYAAGMQLWQIANDLPVLDLTNKLHVGAFLQALSEHDAKPKDITGDLSSFRYPRLDIGSFQCQ